MRARHRLSKLLLRHGIVYSGGKPWTGAHEPGCAPQRASPAPGLQLAFDTAYETVLATLARRDRLDAAITAMAADSEFTPVVRRLGCLRGVVDADRVRAGGRDRRLAPVHRHTRSAPTSGLVPTESSSGRLPRRRARSPRPATATPAGCWSRPPGTTARPTAPGASCAAAGTAPPRPPAPAVTRATGACTPAGQRSTPARSGPSSPTSPSPASWPAGAGPGRPRRLTTFCPETSGHGPGW